MSAGSLSICGITTVLTINVQESVSSTTRTRTYDSRTL